MALTLESALVVIGVSAWCPDTQSQDNKPNAISDSSIELYIVVNSRTSNVNQPFRIFLIRKMVNTMEFNATCHQIVWP